MGNSIESRPKKTRQGNGKHTKYSATPRNSVIKTKRARKIDVYFDCEPTFLRSMGKKNI